MLFPSSYYWLAEHQARLLEQVKTNFPLTKDETQVIMRGRNSAAKSRNRKNPSAYQDSTAFEALIGYLYITDQKRCGEVLFWLDDIVDQIAVVQEEEGK
jgi:ribonuclease III family protein